MARRRTALALALTVAAVAVASTSSAHAADGTGSVVDTLTATVVAGGLTIAGAGANVALSSTPGSFSTAAGATALTMTDTTASDNGWVVTAAYSAHSPALSGVIDLTGANVKVTASNVLPSATISAAFVTLGINSGLSPASEQVLSSPVAVMTTGAATGTGISTAAVGYKVRVPADATLGQVYGGKVTYTIASVR